MENPNQAFLNGIIAYATSKLLRWSVDRNDRPDVEGGKPTGPIQQNIYLYPPSGSCITQLHNGHKYPHIHIYYKEDTPQDINYVLSYVKCGDVVHGNGRYDRGKIKPVTVEFKQSEVESYVSQLIGLCKSCDIRAPTPPMPTPLIQAGINKNTTITDRSSSKPNFMPRAVQLGQKNVNAPVRVERPTSTNTNGGKSTRRRRSNTHRRIKQKKRKTKKNNSRRRKNTRK